MRFWSSPAVAWPGLILAAAVILVLPISAWAPNTALAQAAPATNSAGVNSATSDVAARKPLISTPAASTPDHQANASFPTGQDNQVAANILIEMFVLALLLESALALVFNWRPFLYYFDSRGIRTVVSLFVSALLVKAVNFDGMFLLLRAYSPAAPDPVQGDLLTFLLTAMIIAGGSSGVNNIFVALGLRSKVDSQSVAPKPPPTEAWLSVRLLRDKSKGPVLVQLGSPGGVFQTAGIISGSVSPPEWMRFFVRDPTRFPTAGGHVVSPGAQIILQLEGSDGANVIRSQPLTQAYAPGAVVDYVVKL